jgi:hypothetical protein
MPSPRSPLTRSALAVAAAALLTTAAAAPAAGGDGRGGTSDSSSGNPSADAHRVAAHDAPRVAAQHAGTRGDRGSRFSRGLVVARGGVALRSRPDRGSRVLRIARPGEIVWIFCRTLSRDAHGSHGWYLLADRAWAWVPARAIENIGRTPRWC